MSSKRWASHWIENRSCECDESSIIMAAEIIERIWSGVKKLSEIT